MRPLETHEGSDWQTQTISSIEDFSRWFACTAANPELVYRGQADSAWRLQPSIDRRTTVNTEYEAQLQLEEAFLNRFGKESRHFLDRVEAAYMETSDKLSRFAVVQHFGGVSRLLDWTESVAAACYFACVDKPNRDGTVWWIDQTEVRDWVHARWDAWGFSRKPESDDRILDPIFDDCEDRFVCMQYLRLPFRRIDAQRGLFTFASRLGLSHDEYLAHQVPFDKRGKVVIAANFKDEAVNYLSRLGINAVSLHHSGADRVGLRLAWERDVHED